MEGEVAITRHFFIVMVPGFQNLLDLPSSFCEKLKEEKSKQAILRSRIGKYWKMDVYKNSELGLICFKNGWPQFVHHHGLSVGDFLVFEHTGDFNFNVSIFDHTACQKDFLVEPNKKPQVKHDHHPRNAKRESDKATAVSYDSPNPHFALTMNPTFAKTGPGVSIPAEFLRSNIDLSHKCSITLRDPHRRAWPVKLRLQTNTQSRLFMTKGWLDFYASNDLKNGDACVFELDNRSLQSTTTFMDVQIYRAPV